MLLDIGVIKRVTGTYRYYLTKAGRAAIAAAGRLTLSATSPMPDGRPPPALCRPSRGP
jgi:hypothetical protein